MTEVLTAILTMAVVVAGGALVQSRGWLPGNAREVLATVCFSVAGPCLLLSTVARADLSLLASTGAAVTWGTTLALALALWAVSRWGLRLPTGQATVTTLAGSYVNAGNLGIPLAVYLFGDALAVVPTMLVQLLIMAPVAFAILSKADDASPTTGARRDRGIVVTVVGNPLTLATLVGLALAALPSSLPDAALEPFALVGAAAPPLALLTLGMALVVDRRAEREPHEGPPPVRPHASVLTATLTRGVIHPALTWGVGAAAGLSGTPLAVVVAMAALPTAQNVVVYAQRYRCALDVAARACVATTVLCGPVLIVVAALL